MDSFRRNALRIYLLLVSIAGFATLVALLREGSDPESAWLFGFSRTRLLMAGGVFVVAAALASLAWLWPKATVRVGKSESNLQGWVDRNWAIAAVLVFGILLAGGIYYGNILSTESTDAYVMGRLARIAPLLIWLGTAGIGAMLTLPILRFGKDIRAARISRETLPSWTTVRRDFERTVFALRALLGPLRWGLAGAAMLYPAWSLLYKPLEETPLGLLDRLLVFLAAFLATIILAGGDTKTFIKWPAALGNLVVLGAVFAAAKLLVFVTDYPFTLYWSEGNRAWDYSVLFGRARYIYPAGQPIEAYIDLGRQSLWGLPFLIPNFSYAGIRLWNAVLFSIPYMVLGWIAIRPRRGEMFGWLLFGVWGFVFLNNGPVYTPLIVAAILVAGVRRAPLWLAMPVVFAAGMYAQMTRWMWLFAPAMWAGMIALVLPSLEERKLGRRDWVRAILLGLAGILGGYGVPYVWPALQTFVQSGGAPNAEQAQAIIQSLTVQSQTGNTAGQALLWSRLWPNLTYPPGIVLGVVLVSLPLLFILALLHRRGYWRLGGWQIAASAGILLAFLGVGVVASVKIGGGTNLHNLDMYLVGLLIVAALAWEAGIGSRLGEIMSGSGWLRALLLAMVAIQAFMPMLDAEPLALPPEEKTANALNFIRNASACAKEHGEVLFMDQRQLLAFGYVQDVPLVPEYEKKLVLDEALAGDEAYFEAFYRDLAEQRFSLIITERQAIRIKENTASLADENNLWVKWVTIPLLKHYESIANYKLVGVELFMPIGRDYTCPVTIRNHVPIR